MERIDGVERRVRVEVERRGRWTVLRVEMKDLDRAARDRAQRSLEGFAQALLSRLGADPPARR